MRKLRRTPISIALSIAALSLPWVPSAVGAETRPGVTQRLATASAPVGGRDEGRPSVSASGRYVAFVTEEQLAAVDTNKVADVYRLDSRTGRVDLVSADANGLGSMGECVYVGGPPKAGSESPSISADGRYVAFTSCAVNLVPADTNLSWDAFVRDMKKATTTRISESSDGDQQLPTLYNYTDGANRLDISADGGTVAFTSDALNLVKGDTNGTWDVFVHNMVDGTTVRASVNEEGEEGLPALPGQVPPPSHAPELSADGRFVAWESEARNFVPGDGNAGGDVFVRDMLRGKIERVSVATGGGEVCCTGWHELAMDGSGRHVAFVSCATTLVPNDANSPPYPLCTGDVFVHDRKTNRTERVSVSSSGEEGDGLSGWGSVETSADGRYLVFDSYSDNFFDEPTCDLDKSMDVFVHDRATGALDPQSVTTQDPTCPRGFSTQGTVSGTGNSVAFLSEAPHLAEGEDNEGWATFFRDRGVELGVGGLGPQRAASRGDRAICLTLDGCLAPNDPTVRADEVTDLTKSLTEQGANLYGASLAYRPQYEDLFIDVELEYMPQVRPGASPIIYGLRFQARGKRFEIRATSLSGGTFGLFDCSNSIFCRKVAQLSGGYGTTGMRVVVSLPLQAIGLSNGGKLDHVEAYSALGGDSTGALKILDAVRIP